MKNFVAVMEEVKRLDLHTSVAAVWTVDEATIEACLDAYDHRLATPLLIGDESLIRETLYSLKREIPAEWIVPAQSPEEAAETGVRLVKEGRVDCLLKGALDTKVLLKPVVNKDTGIRSGTIMSHIAFNEVPTYHKLLARRTAVWF